MLRLLENEKVVCEGAGAVGLAALLEGVLPELKVCAARRACELGGSCCARLAGQAGRAAAVRRER